MTTHYYDIVIIGAGPAGLALAHACSHMKKKILILDRENEIGGCHRVKRVKNNMFTEHGPRIYLSSFLNFFNLVYEMGLKIDDVFVKYKYDLFNVIITKVLPSFTFSEIIVFSCSFMLYLLNNNYGNDVSLKEYANKYGFSHKAQDILDRMCRFTDGGSIETYSLNKILSMQNAMFMVDVYQPKKPLDTTLFPAWKQYLQDRQVDFVLGANVSYIHKTKHNNKIQYIVLDDKKIIYLNDLVLAVPPSAMVNILQHSNCPNCFANIDALKEWSEKTKYIEYISITYHFREKLHLPIVNGMTIDSDWGIIVINLSDYMHGIEEGYNTVLSAAISKCDTVSKNIMKTANECSKEELYAEVFRQLKKSIYPDLHQVEYIAIMNPNIYYDTKKNKWTNIDEAYFNTVRTPNLAFRSKEVRNIYNVGTHNGYAHISYTTIESAVSNALVLSGFMFPQLRWKYSLRRSLRLSDIIVLALIFIVIIGIICFSLSNIV
jgi:hypothetical protein